MSKAVTTQFGLVLIFGLVVAAISMIYVGSKPIVDGVIKANHEMELEQSLNLLHANLMKVAFEGVPSRVTEMKTYEGYLSILNTSYVIVGNNTTIYIGQIVYGGENRDVVIENGGVFAVYRNGTLILQHPLIICRGDTTLLPIIQLEGSGSTGGRGVLRVRFDSIGGGVFEATNKTVVVHSELRDVWADLLEDANFTVTLSGDDIIATCNSDKLLIKYVYIRIELLR
jgi:hypothetical protein